MKVKLSKGLGEFFALDIGTKTIRVVQLAGAVAHGWELKHYGYAEVDQALLLDSSDIGREKFGNVLQQVIAQSGITAKNVVVGLPSSKIFTTIIDVPNQTVEDLKSTIKYQIDHYVPMSVADAKVDYVSLGTSPQNNQTMEVLLASVAKTYSEERLELLENLGYNVIGEEPDSLAMARAVFSPDIPDASLAIDMGELSTDVVVYYAGAPRVIRSIPGGFSGVIRGISSQLGIREDQARQFLMKFGLVQDKLDGQIFKAADGAMAQFFSELKKTINFFQMRYQNIPIKNIVTTGFSGVVPFMPEYIEMQVAIPTAVGNPWHDIRVNEALQQQLLPIASEFAVAVGLAKRRSDV
ncbi:MAG: pilus assembly protein PilM [Candidatus Nomurabacteria bacterium]|jgi:type IV pilus assembly protein PilM|nr:pilus assembly protein PilM [Candidatus Nomurabacteria bacterium]